MDEIEPEEKWKIIDNYSQKLLDSGYSIEQVRKIIVNDIKEYEGRKIR